MRYEARIFNNEPIELDDNEFVGCHFEACELVYTGGAPPVLQGCSFINSHWTFAGPAENTLRFLAALYHTAGQGGQELIEETFENIRRGWSEDILH